MRRLLLSGLAVALLLGLAAATHPATWRASFHNALCAGPCCVVADGFVEVSCGEYGHP